MEPELSCSIFSEWESDTKSLSLQKFGILDQHDQWITERQAATINTFNAIMYSIQVDLSYILIERILVHLDKKVTSINAKGN